MYNSNILSIIICTYNRSELLTIALQSLADQSVEKSSFDVIVIDNNSIDNTANIVKDFEDKLNLKYFKEEKQGLSHSRNRGIIESLSKYVAFVDDDAKADKEWVENAYKTINEVNPEIFGGPIYPYYQSSKPKWFKDSYGSFFICDEERYLNYDEFLCGSNIFFKKEIFKKIGNFDVNIGMKGDKISLGEDVKIQSSAKNNDVKIYHNNNLIVYHLVPDFKMKLKYITKRHILSVLYSGKIFSERKFGNLIYNFFYYIAASLGWLLFFPFKKKDYPYFLNLLIEKIFPKLERAFINFVAIFYKLFRRKI